MDTLRLHLRGHCLGDEEDAADIDVELRAALAGRAATPSVYDMMLVIGRDETIARLTDAAA